MGRSNYTPRSAEENARRSLEAAQKNEVFKAMPQVEAEPSRPAPGKGRA